MMYFALSFIVLVSAFLDDGEHVHGDDPEAAGDRRDEGAGRCAGADRAGVSSIRACCSGVLGAALGIVLGRVVIRFRGEIQEVFRALAFRSLFSIVRTGFDVLPAHHNP
jgi:lipoprotein-releasing system permease protein